MKTAYFYGGLTTLLWSTIAFSTKLMLTNIDSMQILSGSMFFATSFLLLLNLIKGNRNKMKQYTWREYLDMFCLGTLGLFLYNLLLYIGIDYLSASQAFIINYLWPLMTVIFACLILKEPLTLRKAFSITLSFVGVIIIATDNGLICITPKILIGTFCCVLAAAFYGLFSVLNKQRNYDSYVSMLVYHFSAFILSFLTNLLVGKQICPDFVQLPGLMWLGIATSAIGYTFWAIALSLGDTAKLSAMAYLTPFLSLIWTTVLLKEPIRFSCILGLLIIIIGILLQAWKIEIPVITK